MHTINRGLALASVLFLANFGEKSQDGAPILSKNYYGTIKLIGQEKPITAEKITIAHKNKDIQVYSKPQATTDHDFILKSHPRDSQATAYLDFDEITTVAIAQPAAIWKYNKNGRDILFVEIQVTLQDSGKVKTFIIETPRQLYYSEPDAVGEAQSSVPLMALEKITFDGCHSKEALARMPKPAKKPCDVSGIPGKAATPEPIATKA